MMMMFVCGLLPITSAIPFLSDNSKPVSQAVVVGMKEFRSRTLSPLAKAARMSQKEFVKYVDRKVDGIEKSRILDDITVLRSGLLAAVSQHPVLRHFFKDISSDELHKLNSDPYFFRQQASKLVFRCGSLIKKKRVAKQAQKAIQSYHNYLVDLYDLIEVAADALEKEREPELDWLEQIEQEQ